MHQNDSLKALAFDRRVTVCPARAQDEGLQQFQQYLCKLVAERAREHYNILVEGGEHMTQTAASVGHVVLQHQQCAILTCTHLLCDLPGSDGGQDDFVEAATSLFQDVAVSVEENEGFLRASFGAEALLAVITSLHGEVGAA